MTKRIAGGLVLGLLGAGVAGTGAAPGSDALSDAVCGYYAPVQGCATVDPVQPDEGSMAFTGRVLDTGAEDFTFTMYGNSQNTIVVDGVPFAQYWQLDEPDKYVFHPMVWGRYVFENDDPAFAARLPELVGRTGHDLPDGSVAFYYPNHYPLNRMSGPDLMYSAISQSELLAGFVAAADRSGSDEVARIAERVLGGLLFPYESGGVNLDGLALLEFPLFRSNPEIILNGWLHALLHLNDWAIVHDDAEAARILERNLEFLVSNHAVWYDGARNVSRYSDTSPFRAVLEGARDDQSYRVFFDARNGLLRDYVHAPVDDPDGEYSGYDTRFVSRKGRTATLGTTCSGLFDTVIASDAAFSLRFRPHVFDPTRATPSLGDGETIIESSEVGGGFHEVRIEAGTPGLICGYPTNFAKANGRNFYHGQHIVALSYLAAFGAFDDNALKDDLQSIAEEWRVRTAAYASRTLDDFEPLQVVLDSINRGKVLTQATTISELGLVEYGAPRPAATP